jgi:two-component system, NarL family, response regulator LiaR
MEQFMSAPIRILLADDQKLIRHALSVLLDQESDLQIVGEAETRTEAMTLARTLNPHIIVLDPAISENTGIEVLPELIRHLPAARVLILTNIDDEEFVLRALQMGATGYLLKTMAPTDLIQAIRATAEDGAPLHPRVARRMLNRFLTPAPRPDSQPHLTVREREILHLIGEGYSNREIAQKLVITQFTVRTHVCRVLKKLKLNNRTQAALYVVRQQQKLANGPPS